MTDIIGGFSNLRKVSDGSYVIVTSWGKFSSSHISFHINIRTNTVHCVKLYTRHGTAILNQAHHYLIQKLLSKNVYSLTYSYTWDKLNFFYVWHLVWCCELYRYNNIYEIIRNANLMQKGNFITVFLVRHVSGTYAHHQEH